MPLGPKTMNKRIFHPANSPVEEQTAKEFGGTRTTGKLPEHQKLAHGGEVCPHCEGQGYFFGGEVVPEHDSLNWTPEAEQSEDRQRRFDDLQRSRSPAYYNLAEGGEVEEEESETEKKRSSFADAYRLKKWKGGY